MIFKENDTIKLVCPLIRKVYPEAAGVGPLPFQKEIFIMRVRDEIVIIDNDVGVSLKIKKGTWFNRLERVKKHRTAFKEFLAKTKATTTEIIGIDLK